MFVYLQLLTLHSIINSISGWYTEPVNPPLENDYARRSLLQEFVNEPANYRTSQVRGIRMTANFDNLRSQFGDSKTNRIIGHFDIARNLFSKIIMVNPISNSNQFFQGNCSINTNLENFQIPNADQTSGVAFSDLHIYFTAIAYPDNHLAWSVNCIQTVKGPLFARINLNLSKYEELDSFMNDMDFGQIIIHELAHILAFHNPLMWVNKDTKAIYGPTGFDAAFKRITINGVILNFLKTPNLQQYASYYFNCPNAEGVQIEIRLHENDIHLHQDTFNDDCMTATLEPDCVFSYFMIAALMDTNYYAQINQNIYQVGSFGRNRGCDFIHQHCNQTKFYFTDEYCDDIGAQSVSPNRLRNAQCGFSKYEMCAQWKSFFNSGCNDVSDQQVIEYFGDSYSPNSRAYSSSFVQSGSLSTRSFRCLATSCSADNTIAYFTLNTTNSPTFECRQNNADVLPKLQGYEKSVTCPDDILDFCSTVSYQTPCPQNCNYQGTCVQGFCYCQRRKKILYILLQSFNFKAGFMGVDCSSTFSGPKPAACAANFFIINNSPNFVCYPNNVNLAGYFKNTALSLFIRCHYSCLTCNDVFSNSCVTCSYESSKSGSNCVKQPTVKETINGILKMNDYIMDPSKNFRFQLTQSGNLFLVQVTTNSIVWMPVNAAIGIRPFFLSISITGNIQMKDSYYNLIWESSTGGLGDAPHQIQITTDGKVVLYDKNNILLWDHINGKLRRNTWSGVLYPNDFMQSLNKRYQLFIDKIWLVLYDGNNKIWQFGGQTEFVEGIVTLTMMPNGNIFLACAKCSIYYKQTSFVDALYPQQLILDDTGDLYIVDANNKRIWGRSTGNIDRTYQRTGFFFKNQYLESANQIFRAFIRDDTGHFVIKNVQTGVQVWSNGIGVGSQPNKYLFLEGSGQVNVANDLYYWQLQTAGYGEPPHIMVMQDSGNLELFDQNGVQYWGSDQGIFNMALLNTTLQSNGWMYRPNICWAYMTSFGNFAAFNQNGDMTFETQTTGRGKAPYRLNIQPNGNMVIYDDYLLTIWSTSTGGKGTPPHQLRLQADCTLKLYDSQNLMIWDSQKIWTIIPLVPDGFYGIINVQSGFSLDHYYGKSDKDSIKALNNDITMNWHQWKIIQKDQYFVIANRATGGTLDNYWSKSGSFSLVANQYNILFENYNHQWKIDGLQGPNKFRIINRATGRFITYTSNGEIQCSDTEIVDNSHWQFVQVN